MRYAPLFSTNYRSQQDLSHSLKSCAVVSLILTETSNPEILFIKRAQNPNDKWSGQIGFPGGRMENFESHHQTALRETLEEIGLSLHTAENLGILDDIQGRKSSHLLEFYVRPFIFSIEEKVVDFIPDPSEVESVHWVTMEHLLNSKYHINYQLIHPETQQFMQLPGVQLPNGDILWGLSYVMLTDLLNKSGLKPDFWKEYFR